MHQITNMDMNGAVQFYFFLTEVCGYEIVTEDLEGNKIPIDLEQILDAYRVYGLYEHVTHILQENKELRAQNRLLKQSQPKPSEEQRQRELEKQLRFESASQKARISTFYGTDEQYLESFFDTIKLAFRNGETMKFVYNDSPNSSVPATSIIVSKNEFPGLYRLAQEQTLTVKDVAGWLDAMYDAIS